MSRGELHPPMARAGPSASERHDPALARLEHRVRTRLTVACGWLDLLLDARIDDPGDVRRALRTVREQLGGLETLLRESASPQVIDVTAGGAVQTVDLRDAVDSTLAGCPWAGSSVRAEPRVVGRSWPLEVEPAALHDVLLHLLDNAVEHTPPDTPVEVVLDYRPDAVDLVVEDAGRGVTMPRGDAVGTGLAVVEHLAAGLGATVAWARSSRLGGAAVRLRWSVDEGALRS